MASSGWLWGGNEYGDERFVFAQNPYPWSEDWDDDDEDWEDEEWQMKL